MSVLVESNQIIDTIFKVFEIAALGGGGFFVVFRLGRATAKFEEVAQQQASAIIEIKDDIKALNTLMVDKRVMDERIANISERLNRHERRMDDFSRGEGFVLPIGYRQTPQERLSEG